MIFFLAFIVTFLCCLSVAWRYRCDMHRRGETVHIGYSAAGCGTKVFTNMVQVGEKGITGIHPREHTDPPTITGRRKWLWVHVLGRCAGTWGSCEGCPTLPTHTYTHSHTLVIRAEVLLFFCLLLLCGCIFFMLLLLVLLLLLQLLLLSFLLLLLRLLLVLLLPLALLLLILCIVANIGDVIVDI